MSTTAAPRTDTRKEARAATRLAPRYRVLLHDDDVNDMDYVTRCLIEVFGLRAPEARAIMSEAHCTGTALCATEPRPEAERHRDQLCARLLSATVEPE